MPSNDISERITETKPASSGYPAVAKHSEKILVTVKTYPSPSKKYREIVCTAGITEAGKWIRLYPLDYRYQNYPSWFSKYQWISVDIEKNASDPRIDSYRPDLATLKILTDPLPTKNKWQARKDIVLPTLEFISVEAFLEAYHARKVSLCIFKPKHIDEFVIEKDDAEWSGQHQMAQSQMVLFGKQTKILEKIPYKFSYKFHCDDSRCKGHTLAIRDWEIFQLYRNVKEKSPFDLDVVLEKVRNRYVNEISEVAKDLYLMIGTTMPFSSPIILGIFWPPKEQV